MATEQMALAERVVSRQSRDDLDRIRGEALGRLTYQFGHELRNALTGVKCYLELLRAVTLPGSVAGFLEEVETGVDRATELAARWLELARCGNTTSYVNEQLQRLHGFFLLTGLERRIRFETSLDEQAGNTSLDPGALASVLLVLAVEMVERRPRVLRFETTALSGRILVTIEAEELALPARPFDLVALSAELGAEVSVRPAGFAMELPESSSQELALASAVGAGANRG